MKVTVAAAPQEPAVADGGTEPMVDNLSPQKTISIPTREELFYVNPYVSWQAKLLNASLKRVLKNRMGRFSSIHKLRQFMRLADSMLSAKVANGISIEEIDTGGLKNRWYKPEQPSDSVVLYLHGGGFCLHMPKLYDGVVSNLSSKLGINAMLPDYRLAPEHPFPAAPQDAFRAYQYLLNQGFTADRIVIVGDSAGGCLTLSLLMRIRNEGLAAPCCAVMLSPATDHPGKDPSLAEFAELDPMFNLETLTLFAGYYMSEKHHRDDPQAMPLNGDFRGLPPLQFHAGSTELLLPGVINAAHKAELTGVKVSLNIWDQMPHVHSAFWFIPESTQAVEMIAKFIQTQLQRAE